VGWLVGFCWGVGGGHVWECVVVLVHQGTLEGVGVYLNMGPHCLVRGHLLAAKQHKRDCGFGRVVVLVPFGTHTLSVSTQPFGACACSIMKGV
jgi:hypothetical protein